MRVGAIGMTRLRLSTGVSQMAYSRPRITGFFLYFVSTLAGTLMLNSAPAQDTTLPETVVTASRVETPVAQVGSAISV